MFSQLALSEDDARMLVRAGEWCNAPRITVSLAERAIADRKAARDAFSAGAPAAPVGEACSRMRTACEALSTALAARRGACGVAYGILSCAEHQLAPTLSDAFKKILSSCSEPSAQEHALAASESGRAFANIRANSIKRANLFAVCCALSSLRDDLTLADGTLSFDRLHLLYKIVRRVFEEPDQETALLRGKAAVKIATSGADIYDTLVGHETWILSNSSVQNAQR